ncbi:MAG: hypothetical protein DRQ47_01690 [Gammaproteobacteria bacterium]|nr:MAG: hypothetical protein DRQ47_01690 [Gammaproteobacteria bacterium]
MKIDSISLKSSTIAIFVMIGLVAIALSLFASNYFKRAALNAQMTSLSRVIEVASIEVFTKIKNHTFDFGSKLAHNPDLLQATKRHLKNEGNGELSQLLDDPFINGFVGFSKIDLKKLRIYDLQLKLISQSNMGVSDLDDQAAPYIRSTISNRGKTDRLKAVQALWASPQGPFYSLVVPLGGLRPIGYLEIIINPVFNFSGIGNITNTPVHIHTMSGELLNENSQQFADDHLPIEFLIRASDETPLFKVVSYENIAT